MIDRIREKRVSIAVLGLGRIGLPIAVMFANAGYHVIGTDTKKEAVEAVSSPRSHRKEPELDLLIKEAVKARNLTVTRDAVQAVRQSDIAIVCVQTPLSERNMPDLTYLAKACEFVGQGLRKKKLVIIESSVPPGTIKNLVVRVLEDRSGLQCGQDFWLAYCPERTAPGNVMREIVETARIVGGYNSESANIAAELFRTVTRGDILITDYVNAEVAKLAENVFRDVNIAFANELALLCERLGVDVMEVIKLANTHPRVRIHNPGCGVGGPCLPKDPYLLLHPFNRKALDSKMTEFSQKLNDEMVQHTVKLVNEALKKAGKNTRNSKVAILGTAYKGETTDATNSPARKIIKRLTKLGAEIMVYDPYCDESFGAEKVGDIKKAIERADCLVIVTDHRAFMEMKLKEIKALMNEKPAIVDGRRIVNPDEAKRQGFAYYGVGYGVKSPTVLGD